LKLYGRVIRAAGSHRKRLPRQATTPFVGEGIAMEPI